MGVNVDEAGRDDAMASVDLPARRPRGPRLDGDDPAIVHEDVGFPSGRAGAVDDEPVPDRELGRHPGRHAESWASGLA